MLEGPAEQRALWVGQWLADQFAYRRINKRFAAYTRSFVKANRVPGSELRRATLSAAREAFLVRKSPRAFTTLRFYALSFGQVTSGFIDEVEYWRRLHRSWGGKARAASDAKTLTRKLLSTEQLPDLGYFVNGSWFNLQWQRVSRAEIVRHLKDADEVVVKADFSERGNAVRVISRAAFLEPSFSVTKNSVVQDKISQHPLFGELMPGKEATVRLVTAYWPGSSSPKLLSGLAKWDVLGADITSRLKINVETGKFVPPLVKSDWTQVALPPLFQGRLDLAAPGFSQAKALILDLHKQFPHYQLIGWDLGIDEHERPWIFEWNADHPAIFTAQAMNGPILEAGRNTLAPE